MMGDEKLDSIRRMLIMVNGSIRRAIDVLNLIAFLLLIQLAISLAGLML